MPRNKRAQRGHTNVGPTRSQIFNPTVFLEYDTKQSLYVIAVQDAKKVQDACAKWQDYLRLQELLARLR